RQSVASRQGMIDAHDILVVSNRRRRARTAIVDARLAGIRRGHELVEKLARERSDARHRNYVARERLSGHWIENRRGDTREGAGPQHSGRNQSCSAEGPRDLASGLPVEKEESLILPSIDSWNENRSAEVCPTLVSIEPRWLCAGHSGLKSVERRERIVTVQLPRRAMKRV